MKVSERLRAAKQRIIEEIELSIRSAGIDLASRIAKQAEESTREFEQISQRLDALERERDARKGLIDLRTTGGLVGDNVFVAKASGGTSGGAGSAGIVGGNGGTGTTAKPRVLICDGWLNVYEGLFVTFHPDRKHADERAAFRCRLACVKVGNIHEGEGL